MLAQERQHVTPLLYGNGAVLDDLADEPVCLLATSLEQEDHGQRDLAFSQIAADRLAERDLVRGKVEQVVDELERDAEIEAVLTQRVFAFGTDRAEFSADLGAAAKQERGLAADDLEVLLLRDIDVAGLGQLI